MIASNIALTLLLAVANGKNKLALGLDASSQFDQVSQDEQVTSTVDNFLHNNTGKRKSLRGFDGVNTNALERSSHLVGVSTGAHVGANGAGGDDKIFAVERMLQDCSTPSWHPQYSGGWDAGHCAFEATCNSPGYASELTCCKSAYAGQISGYCLSQLEAPPTTSPTTSDLTVNFWYPGTQRMEEGLGYMSTSHHLYLPQLECCKTSFGGQMSGACLSQLESPPTTSPTTAGNIGSLYYPDYNTAWPDAGCINVLPVPSGRPTYASHLACCKGAYGGQVSGVCLSQLDSPPTMSPTSVGGLDVYYPDYNTAWDKAACVNTRPMPSGRPAYSTMLACCKGSYAGQTSGYCLSQLDSPPTTSPTSSDYTADFWYPDYSSDWSDAGCLNSLPLPFSTGGRPTYTTNAACCSAAYGGQVSKACLCSMASPPAGCPTPSPDPATTTTVPATVSVFDYACRMRALQALTNFFTLIIEYIQTVPATTTTVPATTTTVPATTTTTVQSTTTTVPAT
ncbi:hypothetical protein THAOC_26098, partial [Thalassiosira oceanica]